MTRGLSLLALLCCLVGCATETFDPFDNDERYFTVYGFLDQLELNHSIRVVPVTRSAEYIPEPTEEYTLDARVYTTDLTTGAVTEWSHAFERLSDGTWGHVFHARFLVTQGRRYRLEVVRSDGKMAWAETQVPNIPDAILAERGPIEYSADSSRITQEIIIPRIPSPWDIQAAYFLNNLDIARPLQKTYYVPYGRSGSRTEDGGWRIRLDMSRDTREVRKQVNAERELGWVNDSPETALNVGLHVRILDQAWDPPDGVFDPEVLAQPDVMTNVEHGYGLFGSIGFYREDWVLDRDVAAALGYEW